MKISEIIQKKADVSLYEITESGTAPGIRKFLASTPETRQICNDPLLSGVAYTDSLRKAVTVILQSLKQPGLPGEFLSEPETVVLHVLRGGLNFGLREALAAAYGWNHHTSAFISAQRARNSADPGEWHITESEYAKVYLPTAASVVFGDVVATGTSLEFALKRLLHAVIEKKSNSLRSLLFFTFGGSRAGKIVADLHQRCRRDFPEYTGAAVVYLEGLFTVADSASSVQIKVPGTDLLRRDALLAPEFLKSQYENPAYPLERCAIYDAGSRAFWLPGYFADVSGYWHKLLELAENGMTFTEILKERCPACGPEPFGEVDLSRLCRLQLGKLKEKTSAS